MSRLCTPYHIAYLVRAAESYGCITSSRANSKFPGLDIVRDLAERNWVHVHGFPYRGERYSDEFLRYALECREAFDSMPIMEEDARPVLTIAACHWYQAQCQRKEEGIKSTQSKRLVDSIIVAASYQLPCMEEECGIL
jgi:hypothetical protein